MSLLLLNQKKQSIQSEFNQPLSKFKPRIIKGDNGINSNAIVFLFFKEKPFV